MKYNILWIFIVSTIYVNPLHTMVILDDSTAAEISDSDSLYILSGQDSSMTDSIVTDTTKYNNDKLESKIYYWAEKGTVSRISNRLYLEGNAKLIYQNLTLESAKIMIDQEKNYLFAEGIIDTIDSLGNPVYKGTPIFTEKGKEPIYGNTLHYDFRTKRGKINYGKTQMSPGYYKGNRIHKIGEKTLLVKEGYFTSCEFIDDPHFYFKSNKMRVHVDDKIVAKPVYLYIADVPILAIPFGVFPNKKGRHSGIVIPSYGVSGYGGRFLKDIGYYWAPNDYIDATFLTDFYDKRGFTFKSDLSYTIRYLLNGKIRGLFLPRDINTGEKRRRWSIEFNHSQTIDPTFRISASGKFQSDQQLERDFSSDINRRTNQIITSNLTISKKFKGTKNSLSLNVSRTENLQNGNLSYTLPNLRFSRSQSSIYEAFTGKSIRGKRGWYQDIYFSYNSRLLHKGIKAFQEVSNSYQESESQGIEHNLSVSSPQKILKYFNFSPSVNYREVWVNEITEGELDRESNSIITKQKKQFAIRRTFNSSVAMKTTLYGLFEPNIGTLKFIRHKLDPQISFTYTPDFSSPFYNYYDEVADTSGNITKIDKFQKNPFGATPRNESQFMRISLANLFQAKFIEGEEEKKVDLFTLNFNTGYNFKADSLQWQNLSTSFRATPLRGININISTAHSFYKADENGRTINEKGSFLRLLNLSASTAFSLDNTMFVSKDEDEEEKTEEPEEELMEGISEAGFIQQDKISDEFAAKNLEIPWRVNLNLNYSKNPVSDMERFDVGTNASITLTKKWRINWTARLDLVKKDIIYQSFSIYRDLHCWEMTFNWQPTIDYYSFQINVKTQVLRDLKVTKHPSNRAYY